MSESLIHLSKAQKTFVTSTEELTLFCGGVGSGKTHAGAVWAMIMALTYPKAKGFITANSYSQLKKATLSTFFKILEENGVDYVYKSQDGIVVIGKTQIYCMSAEKYDNARGIEVGWHWADEVAFSTRESFDVFAGRLRDGNGPCQWKGTTTPNGFNWVYDEFVTSPSKSSKIVTGRTSDNAQNLGGSYLERLQGQYDAKLAKQELDGEFVNLNSGSVYYTFDRRKHVTKCPDANGRYIFIGLDFNVHPLCGVFVYTVGSNIYVFDEIYQEDSNTFEAAREIKQRYPHQTKTVVADDSGTKRKTNAVRTDYEILRRANLDVAKFRNPKVKDRYNNINRLLEQKKIIIDPKCVKLIGDLEKMTYDNKDPLLSHISDALGYVVWKLNPLQKERPSATVSYR